VCCHIEEEGHLLRDAPGVCFCQTRPSLFLRPLPPPQPAGRIPLAPFEKVFPSQPIDSASTCFFFQPKCFWSTPSNFIVSSAWRSPTFEPPPQPIRRSDHLPSASKLARHLLGFFEGPCDHRDATLWNYTRSFWYKEHSFKKSLRPDVNPLPFLVTQPFSSIHPGGPSFTLLFADPL